MRVKGRVSMQKQTGDHVNDSHSSTNDSWAVIAQTTLRDMKPALVSLPIKTVLVHVVEHISGKSAF